MSVEDILIIIKDDEESFRGYVFDAVLIKFPAVYFAIVVGVHFFKELVKFFLDHLLIEVLVGAQLIPHPALELPLLQDVAPIRVVLQEDVLHELLTKTVHINKI